MGICSSKAAEPVSEDHIKLQVTVEESAVPYNIEDYQFVKRTGETLVKARGSLKGAQFAIQGCSDCDIFIMDYTGQVAIDDCKNCRIFIGPCGGSVFFRTCSSCKFVIACQQLRTRDCCDIDLLLYSRTKPIIETTKRLRLGCFQFAFSDLRRLFDAAELPLFHNLWSNVHDFTPAPQNYGYFPASTTAADLFGGKYAEIVGAEGVMLCPVPCTHPEVKGDSKDIFLAVCGAKAGLSLLDAISPLFQAAEVVPVELMQGTGLLLHLLLLLLLLL